MYSFLPAKPGVGATTLAVNTAVALAKGDDTRVFLGDFDLNCGLIRFMLQLRNSYSVLDASQKAEQIDENLWPQLVTSFGTLDVMHAGTSIPRRGSRWSTCGGCSITSAALTGWSARTFPATWRSSRSRSCMSRSRSSW